MKRSSLFSFLILGTLLLLWTSAGGSTTAAMPLLGITDTPTSPPPTDTPEPPTDTPLPPTDTPEPPTNTPEPPTDTPAAPTDTPPPPRDTPVAPTNTPVQVLTPIGTLTLPEAGEANPAPLWLLLVVVGGLLSLGTWLLGQSKRLF